LYGSVLSPDFVAVEEDGKGPRGRQTAIDEVNTLTLNNYHLSDFKVKPLGPDAALVTYTADVDGSVSGQPLKAKLFVSEAWARQNGKWLSTYYQETALK
jgi:hypothetical protein